MPDLFPEAGTVFIHAMICLACLWIAGTLTWAAGRNHFWRHTTRPVVIASAFLFGILAVEFAKRAVSGAFPLAPWHWMLVTSGPVDDLVNVLLLISIMCWFFVVGVAYPDTHRSKGERHDRTSHSD